MQKRILWNYAVPIAAMHLLGLLALVPWLFSWTGVIAVLVGVHVFGGFGINLCYHRLLAHRSLRVPAWLEHTFAVLAMCCLEDTPARWVATHRFHHQTSDEQDDPHSPLVSFLWSHLGWLLVVNSGTHDVGAYERHARDVLKDRFYMFLAKRPLLGVYLYMAHAAVLFAAACGIGWAIEGTADAALRFGLSFLVWGVIVRTLLVWHITWSVNSLTHLFGYRSYATGENSRNNWFVALMTLGEGWHNNHHVDPTSASVQHRWWEFDITYYTIWWLKRLGLAKDVVPANRKRRAAYALGARRG